MKYPKIINLLDYTPNQPPKFKTKNWVWTNDESRGNYNRNNKIRLKGSVLSSVLCDYNDTYILVKGTITVAQETAAAPNNTNTKVIFKDCVPFTNWISRISNT